MSDTDPVQDGSGFGFFLRLAGFVVAAGIIGLVLMLILSRAVYAWGFFGAFIAFAIVMLAFGWFYDRRQTRDYEAE